LDDIHACNACNALWYANRAVLWLNYDDTIG